MIKIIVVLLLIANAGKIARMIAFALGFGLVVAAIPFVWMLNLVRRVCA